MKSSNCAFWQKQEKTANVHKPFKSGFRRHMKLCYNWCASNPSKEDLYDYGEEKKQKTEQDDHALCHFALVGRGYRLYDL